MISPNLSLNVYTSKTSLLDRRQIASDTDRDSVTLGVLYCFDLGEVEEPKVEVEEADVNREERAEIDDRVIGVLKVNNDPHVKAMSQRST